MRTGSLLYLLREGFRNIGQNRLMSVATVGTLLSCLLLIGCSVLFSVNVNALVGFVEKQNEVVAFISDDLAESDIEALRGDIMAVDNVSSVEFVDRDTALKNWIEKLGQSGEFYEYLKNDNPLPHSFTIKVADVSSMDSVIQILGGMYGLIKVNAPTDVADAVSGIKQAFTTVSLAIVAILITVSLVIVANTIRITVFSRRKEISIMRYVGATNLFIRLPFLFEGMLLGIIAGILAFFMIWAGYAGFVRWISQGLASWVIFLAGNVVPFETVALSLLLGFVGAGSLIGAIGSMMFIGKHIKV